MSHIGTWFAGRRSFPSDTRFELATAEPYDAGGVTKVRTTWQGQPVPRSWFRVQVRRLTYRPELIVVFPDEVYQERFARGVPGPMVINEIAPGAAEP